MGGLTRYLLAGVGPARAAIEATLHPGWLREDDPYGADLLVLGGVPGELLAAALLELRGQLPRSVATLWVTHEAESPPADLAAALAAHGPVLAARLGDDPSLVALYAGARPPTTSTDLASHDVARPAGDGPARLVQVTGSGDLATEDLVLSFGPIHPALATPLRLVLALDGEQVRHVVREPGYGQRPLPHGLAERETLAWRCDPDAPATTALAAMLLWDGGDAREAAARAERERAAVLLRACARHLELLGMVPAGRRLRGLAARAARDDDDDGEAVASATLAFARSVPARLAMRLRMRGVGALSRERAMSLGVTGSVARASGLAVDAREDGTLAALYAGAGFTLCAGEAAGDDAARFRQRLAEAAQALRLAIALRRASETRLEPRERIELEAPRGRLVVAREGGALSIASPSPALILALASAIVGSRYADALVAVDGFDASAEEAELADASDASAAKADAA